ncbi:MAG: hypothetical protein NWP83_09785 [Spirosomaceae bacterium]|nr:hypothetical protein [Spirosomataceae bacterium]
MSLQYISDHQGEVTGVFIPIQEWDKIRTKLNIKTDPKEIYRQELREAVEQMKLIKNGEMAKPKLEDFLNEIKEL